MSEITDWFKGLPTFTRFWFGLTVGTSLLGKFGLLHPRNLVLLYEPFVQKFQIWRAATALFYYPLSPQTGFHFLINLYFLYSYSLRLETGVFDGRPADYFFMLIFNWIISIIVALLADIMLLMDPMVLSILYIWCQLNKDVIVSFWFGTHFKAMYLPWVLLVFNMLVAGGGLMELVGIFIGHLYYFLVFKYPQDFGGPALLTTPGFLYSLFPNRRNGAGGFGQPPAAGGGAGGGGGGGGGQRHNWGAGHHLGGL